MLALGLRAFRLGILFVVAASTLAAVTLWGAGLARSFAIYVVSTALTVVLATLLEPLVRGSGRALERP